jgi:DHA1 family inner membrane transport protein
MALNTSAIYLGQAVGAAGGGWLLARSGFGALPWGGLAWMVSAAALGLWVRRRGAGNKEMYANH